MKNLIKVSTVSLVALTLMFGSVGSAMAGSNHPSYGSSDIPKGKDRVERAGALGAAAATAGQITAIAGLLVGSAAAAAYGGKLIGGAITPKPPVRIHKDSDDREEGTGALTGGEFPRPCFDGHTCRQ